MKKILLFMSIALLGFAIDTTAQVVSMGAADTIVNTDASTYNTNLKAGVNANVSIQVVANRLSGTAAGTAIVYGAISNGDTSVYLPLDTFTFTNQSVNSHIFDYPTGAYTHYRVVFTSSGTTSIRTRAWLYARKN